MSTTLAELRRESSLTEEGPLAATWAVWLLRGLALLGLLFTAYLTLASLTEGRVAGCSDTGVFNCESVLTSRWSTWMHMPVAFAAFTLFLSLFMILAFAGPLAPPALRKLAAGLVLLLGTAAGGAALWFIGLQAFEVRHFCPWCLAAHACSLALAGVAWCTLSATAGNLRPLGAGGFVMLALLVVGQLLVPPPPKFEVKHTGEMAKSPELEMGPQPPVHAVEKSPLDTAELPPIPSVAKSGENVPPLAAEKPANTKPNAAGNSGGETPAAVSGELPAVNLPPSTTVALKPSLTQPTDDDLLVAKRRARYITVLSGKLRLNVYEQPCLGDPEGPFVVVKMFDYTCHHCRKMHQLLEAARLSYGNRLTVVLLPVPMNGSCNSFVQYTAPPHKDACAIARYALAVHRARPELFPEYNHWLFEPVLARTEAEARAKAAELVGEAALQTVLRGWEIDQQLGQNVAAYGLCDRGPVPKLLFKQVVQQGHMDRPEQLTHLLEQEFPALGAAP